MRMAVKRLLQARIADKLNLLSLLIEQRLAILYVVRLVFAFVALFLPLGHPHVWRQIDTLGVTLRYWLRLTQEANFSLLPAVLHSGDSAGIMAMEWPLLNLLNSPWYFFGPEAGTFLARLSVLLMSLLLVFSNYRIWRGQRLWGVEAERSWLWLPLLGLGLVYFPKFIPDGPAMLLVLAGLGLLSRTPPMPRLAVTLMACGLLMKPTSVVVLFLLLARPQFVKFILKNLVSLVVPLILAAFYYAYVNAWIQSFAVGESLYRIEPQSPWLNIQELIQAQQQLWQFLLDGLLFFGAIPVLAYASLQPWMRPLGRLWCVLLLQLAFIGILDGVHSLEHRYYYFGAFPTLCLIWQAVLKDGSGRSVVKLLWAGMLVSSLIYCAYEWRPLYIETPANRFLNFSECAALKEKLPDWPWQKNHVFRTNPRPFPLIGLCLGEREASNLSPYAIYLHSEIAPQGCELQSETRSLRAYYCHRG